MPEQFAQLQPAQFLPFPGGSPNSPIIPLEKMQQCPLPPLAAPRPPEQIWNQFFKKCPPESDFLSSDFPECSCDSLLSLFPEYIAIEGKAFDALFNFSAVSFGVYVLLATFVVLFFVVSLPFSYFFTRRRINKQLQKGYSDARIGAQFHLQWTTIIAVLLIVSGILATLFGVSGDVKIDILDIGTISTAVPGVALVLLGCMTWWRAPKPDKF